MEKTYNHLYQKYKELFTKADLMPFPMFGFECGIGWYDILDGLLNGIYEHLKISNLQNFQIVQVKEKFGGLRFYVHGADDAIHALIRDAENLSYSTCELCGSRENVKMSHGWIKVACESCIAKNERLQSYEWDNAAL